eukprot:1149745_1
MPAEIINDHLYVFGGRNEDIDTTQIPLSSIEVCAIITMDPTTIPSAFPTTRNPSVSPSNTPSKFPSKHPSTAPIHDPSASPTQQPSTDSTHPTSQPSHPSLRAYIPSLGESLEFTSTLHVTHDGLTYQSSISPTNMNINATQNTFDYVLLMVVILLAVLFSVAAVVLRCYWKRKNKVTELVTFQEDQIKSNNLSVIPLENTERIQTEMAYTNEGPSDADRMNTPGTINVGMVLKGSARMTRGQIHDETNNMKTTDGNMIVNAA